MWELIQANKRKSAMLIVLLALVLVALGYAIGFSIHRGAGGFGILTAVGIWIIMISVSFAGGEKILLATSGAREVTHTQAPQLFNIVEEMQIASGLPVTPRVFIIDSDVPNAFAVGLKPERAAVAVTSGLMARLDRDELQGVIAHELGHIANRDTLFMTLAGVTVGAVIILADLYLRGMRYGAGRGRRSSSKGGGQAAAVMAIVAIVLALLAPLLAQMLYFACSRRREYLADASAAQFTRFPEGLARALEKISTYHGGKLQVSKAVAPMFTVNPLAAAGSASSLFSTHPPTRDRVRVLRGMVGGSSFAAYEQAYRSTHRDQGMIGARTLKASTEAGIRPPSKEEAGAAERWRSTQDLLHKVNRYATIACACGLKIKLPPGFDRPSIDCPRCGAHHQVPVAQLAAAAAALQAAQQAQQKKPQG